MSAPLNTDQEQQDRRRRPDNYRDALAAAAAAMMAPLPVPLPLPTLLRTSEQIIAAREQAATWAKTTITRLWTPVNPYSDKQVTDFTAQAARVMQAAQTSAGRVAAAGQAQQLQSVGVDVGTPTPTLPTNVRAPGATIADGQVMLHDRAVTVEYANDDTARITVADMSTRSIFERPAETFRYARSVGADDAGAQAVQRISGLVDDNLMLAQRIAQQEVIAQAVDLDKAGPKIVGYRRVIHPELSRTGTCGMCIAASTRLYHVAELMPLHAHCCCTVAAVTAEHDPGADANSIDLGDLYKQSGGTSVAHLKRTRYQVDEHGELGPVLVPKRKYKPQTKSGKPYQSSGSRRRARV